MSSSSWSTSPVSGSMRAPTSGMKLAVTAPVESLNVSVTPVKGAVSAAVITSRNPVSTNRLLGNPPTETSIREEPGAETFSRKGTGATAVLAASIAARISAGVPAKAAGVRTPNAAGQPVSGQPTRIASDRTNSKAPSASLKSASTRIWRPASSIFTSNTGPLGVNASPKPGAPTRTIGSNTPLPGASSTVQRKAIVSSKIPSASVTLAIEETRVSPTTATAGFTVIRP